MNILPYQSDRTKLGEILRQYGRSLCKDWLTAVITVTVIGTFIMGAFATNNHLNQQQAVKPTPPEASTPASPTNTPKKSEEIKSKMVVIGNSTFATNGWFDKQLNGDVFLNSVEWLANSDEQNLSIRPKEVKNRRLNLTTTQASIIAWLSLVIVPLFGFILASVTWWKRR